MFQTVTENVAIFKWQLSAVFLQNGPMTSIPSSQPQEAKSLILAQHLHGVDLSRRFLRHLKDLSETATAQPWWTVHSRGIRNILQLTIGSPLVDSLFPKKNTRIVRFCLIFPGSQVVNGFVTENADLVNRRTRGSKKFCRQATRTRSWKTWVQHFRRAHPSCPMGSMQLLIWESDSEQWKELVLSGTLYRFFLIAYSTYTISICLYIYIYIYMYKKWLYYLSMFHHTPE